MYFLFRRIGHVLMLVSLACLPLLMPRSVVAQDKLIDATSVFAVDVAVEPAWWETVHVTLTFTNLAGSPIDLRDSRLSFETNTLLTFVATDFNTLSWAPTQLTPTASGDGYTNTVQFDFPPGDWVVTRLAPGQFMSVRFTTPDAFTAGTLTDSFLIEVTPDNAPALSDGQLTLIAPPLFYPEFGTLAPQVHITGPFGYETTYTLNWGETRIIEHLPYGTYTIETLGLEAPGLGLLPGGDTHTKVLTENRPARRVRLLYGFPRYYASVALTTPAAPAPGLPEPVISYQPETGGSMATRPAPWGTTQSLDGLINQTVYQLWTAPILHNGWRYTPNYTAEAPFMLKTDRNQVPEVVFTFTATPDDPKAAVPVLFQVTGLPSGTSGTITLHSTDRSYETSTSNGSGTFGEVAVGMYTVNASTVTTTRGVYQAAVTPSALHLEPDDPAATLAITYQQSQSLQHTFSPFIDAAGWPLPNLTNLFSLSGVRNYVLGFIVNQGIGTPCTPRWGGYEPYYATQDQVVEAGEDATLHLIDEINALRAVGGTVMLSFGGAANTPIAATCPDVSSLTQAYLDVMTSYGINDLDFDIEGTWVADPASIARRSQALAQLQTLAPQANIWLTLPVLPQGLTPDGVAVVASAVDAGVDLAGINIMAMDYGGAAAPDPNNMGPYAIDALTNTHAQVKAVYTDHGQPRTDTEIWAMLGVTPMIGLNDVVPETFTLADAQLVRDFALTKNLGLLSMWSIGRDRECDGGFYPDAVFPNCSSILQADYAFSAIFNTFGPSTFQAQTASAAPTVSLAETPQTFALEAPYPNPLTAYTTVPYTLPEASAVRIEVFDLLGRSVRMLTDNVHAAGRHEVRFDVDQLPSGPYLVRMLAGVHQQTRRVLVLK